MVNPKKAAKLIREHFKEIATEQFVKNLRDLSHEIDSNSQIEDRQRHKKS